MIRPILFNAEMVKAILDGRKTTTRRICKDGSELTVPDMDFYDVNKRTYAVHNYVDKEHTDKLSIAERACPICPGDILYVRETWSEWTDGYLYKAWIEPFPQPGESSIMTWHPSIHMPKEAARIWLKVTDVRVEQLQEMKDEDCEKEGLENFCKKCSALFSECDTCLNDSGIKEDFKELWNSTIKNSDIDTYGWDANPWVWVIEFERCDKPDENTGSNN